MAKITSKALRTLIDSLEPSVRDAFLASMDDISNSIILSEVERFIAMGDVDAAIRALNIDDAAFTPLRNAMINAYQQGGSLGATAFKTAKDIYGTRVLVRFDVTNPAAERQISKMAGDLITNISTQSKNAVRQTILQGYQAGQGPRNIALDVAGRINSATGRRAGGILTLSDSQAVNATNYRARLLSGDPAEMRKALGMKLRDRRFDSAVRKAIKAGNPLDKATADKLFGRYTNRALKLRAETIARTETGNAVMTANHEAFTQGLAKTGYTEQAVTRIWRDVSDSRVRHTHAAMDGQAVQGLTAPFVTPAGSQLMHPLDASLGAPASEYVNCRCIEETNIDFASGLT